MHAALRTYETEIRVGLSVIVILLLLLNFGTTYVFYLGKRQIGNEINTRILTGLQNGAIYLAKNQETVIPDDQMEIIRQRFDLLSIEAYVLPSIDVAEIKAFAAESAIKDNLSLELESNEIERLLDGDKLILDGRVNGEMIGLRIETSSPGQHILLAAKNHSDVLAVFTSASKTALYLALGVILLILPLTLILPRMILRPFKRMRQSAADAGRLTPVDSEDEVTQIIESYEANIAELKRNEEELSRLYAESSGKARQLEKVNKYILQSIGSGIIHVDLNGKVVEYNRASETILGNSAVMVLGKHYLAAFPDDDEITRLIEAAIIRGSTFGRREIALRRCETPLYLGIECATIFNDSGADIGVALLLTDMTEIKRLQSEIEINRRMATLGEMTAGLAHQLRNSLAAISGFSQLLVKKTDPNSMVGDLAESIRTETKSSEAMVTRFLTFARPLDICPEYIDLCEILRECLEKAQNLATEHNIDMIFRPEKQSLVISGDRMLLKEAIVNIIDNAIQAIEDNGTVEVVAGIYTGRANILISDNGPGISDDIKDEIFTPFVSSRPSGTGLGLALTHKIITLHGGTISFHNRAEGGALWQLSLPVQSTQRQGANEPAGLSLLKKQ